MGGIGLVDCRNVARASSTYIPVKTTARLDVVKMLDQLSNARSPWGTHARRVMGGTMITRRRVYRNIDYLRGGFARGALDRRPPAAGETFLLHLIFGAHRDAPGFGVSHDNTMMTMMMIMMADKKLLAYLRAVTGLGTSVGSVVRATAMVMMRTTKDVMIDGKSLSTSGGLLAAQAPARDNRDGAFIGLAHDIIRPQVRSIVVCAGTVRSIIVLCSVATGVVLGFSWLSAR